MMRRMLTGSSLSGAAGGGAYASLIPRQP
jgi:hypothetical protein